MLQACRTKARRECTKPAFAGCCGRVSIPTSLGVTRTRYDGADIRFECASQIFQ